MNGEDLLELAGRLIANPSVGEPEARYRSAVSRAYYGAYHCAVSTLAAFDVQILENHTGHEQAYRALYQSGVPQAQEAASLLHDLRGDRNEADYKLDKRRFARQENAMLCIETAHDVMNCLQECLQPPTKAHLEQHFRNT